MYINYQKLVDEFTKIQKSDLDIQPSLIYTDNYTDQNNPNDVIYVFSDENKFSFGTEMFDVYGCTILRYNRTTHEYTIAHANFTSNYKVIIFYMEILYNHDRDMAFKDLMQYIIPIIYNKYYLLYSYTAINFEFEQMINSILHNRDNLLLITTISDTNYIKSLLPIIGYSIKLSEIYDLYNYDDDVKKLFNITGFNITGLHNELVENDIQHVINYYDNTKNEFKTNLESFYYDEISSSIKIVGMTSTNQNAVKELLKAKGEIIKESSDLCKQIHSDKSIIPFDKNHKENKYKLNIFVNKLKHFDAINADNEYFKDINNVTIVDDWSPRYFDKYYLSFLTDANTLRNKNYKSHQDEFSIDKIWLNKMNEYLSSLSIPELYNLFGYTYRGDVYVNKYSIDKLNVDMFYRNLTDIYNEFHISIRNGDISQIHYYKPNTNSCHYFPLFFPAIDVLKNFLISSSVNHMYFMRNTTDHNYLYFKNKYFNGITESNFNKLIESLINKCIDDTNVNFNNSYHCKYNSLRLLAPHIDYYKFWKLAIINYSNSLSDIINNAPPTKTNMYVYRGAYDDYFLKKYNDSQKRNNIFEMSNFMSTSLNITKALKTFTNYVHVTNNYNATSYICCIKRILIPSGTKCILMDGVSAFLHLNNGTIMNAEYEILLNLDSKLEIIDNKNIKFCNPNIYYNSKLLYYINYTNMKLLPVSYEHDNYMLINDPFTTNNLIKPLYIFKKFMKPEIYTYLYNDFPEYTFPLVVKGGYGVKALFDVKYNENKIIGTDDIDLCISIKNSAFSSKKECFLFLEYRLQTFVEQNKKFTLDIERDINKKIPILNYTLYDMFKLTYSTFIDGKIQKVSFLNISITDMEIKKEMIDMEVSSKIGIPIQKEEYYLKDYLTYLYMINTPPFTIPGDNFYVKRYEEKGIKKAKGDKIFFKTKQLCNKAQEGSKYKQICLDLIDKISYETFLRTSENDRADYFQELNAILQ